MNIRLGDDIVAIDMHTHVLTSAWAPEPAANESAAEAAQAMARYFKTDLNRPTVHDLAATYRELNMMCVTFSVDSSWATGEPNAVSNDEVLELAAEYPATIIPFGTVDPHSGRRGAREVLRLAEQGMRGFKFHPSTQAFYANDRDVYPIYEAIEQTGRIALFHSGHTGAGAGRPGGGGVRLKFSNPLYADDVAADFPELRIVLAHPSFPWQDEALSVALHKPYVYIDLSGWSPKYFPPNLVQYARTLLKKKMLFGTDYPVITPQRWMTDFEKLGFDEDITRLIMLDNAAGLLGLTD
ncbi:amidohydrolase family protein [Phytoactinopolyspora endophytica]|uniref:amidohydrolase family protein n=1 Tax=Phytoactinopolyspora endophytica TaxID=1642495 RepID=UPI00197C5F98|nr:amidohydrolase family protein [Phytoactinopolyspora endophytica]